MTAEAISHGDTAGSCGQRQAIAAAAAATATTASATAGPAGASGTGSALTAAATRVKTSRTWPARAANRRSHPRTVSSGIPSSAAIRRCPRPRAAAVTAAPITRASYARRASNPAGSSTCVTRHPVHRHRRGRTTRHRRPSPNTTRRGAWPHPGQPAPAARTGQAAFFQHPLDAPGVLAYREHRCSFAPARGPPRGFAKRSRGGPPRNRHAHGVAEHPSPQPEPHDSQHAQLQRRRAALTRSRRETPNTTGQSRPAAARPSGRRCGSSTSRTPGRCRQ